MRGLHFGPMRAGQMQYSRFVLRGIVWRLAGTALPTPTIFVHVRVIQKLAVVENMSGVKLLSCSIVPLLALIGPGDRTASVAGSLRVSIGWRLDLIVQSEESNLG